MLGYVGLAWVYKVALVCGDCLVFLVIGYVGLFQVCWFCLGFSLSFNLLGLLSFNGLGCIDLRNLLSAILLACVLFLLGLFCLSGSFALLNAPTSSSCARVNSSFAFLVWPGFGCQQV